MIREVFPFLSPQFGFFRDHKKVFSNYRKRATVIGPTQIGMAMTYLCIWSLTRNDKVLQQYTTLKDLVSNGVSIYMTPKNTDMNAVVWKYLFENWKFTYNVDLGDGPVGFATFRRTFWMDLYAMSSIFHMCLSALLTCSAHVGLTKARALKLCYLTKRFNLIVLVTEVIIYTVLFKEWELSLGFLLYRLLFYSQVTGLLKMIEDLAPPPPGYY